MLGTEKSKIAQSFLQHEADTGSTQVQVALLSARISHLTEHFKTHAKDYHSRQGLLKLVARRKGLLKYLMKKDWDAYKKLISDLGLRK